MFQIYVVSVVGAFRKGKSFLLNVCLRYLKHKTSRLSSDADWLHSEQKLSGFVSAGGYEQATSGIHIWPEIFLLPAKDGEEVAVLLVEYEGIDDPGAAPEQAHFLLARPSHVFRYGSFRLRPLTAVTSMKTCLCPSPQTQQKA